MGEYQLLTSAEILDEIANKLKNKFKFPEENIQELIDILLTYCYVIEPTNKIDIVRDKMCILIILLERFGKNMGSQNIE